MLWMEFKASVLTDSKCDSLLQNPDDEVRRNNEVKFGGQVSNLVTRVGNVSGCFKPQTLVRK